MMKSTNTVNIEGTVIDHDTLKDYMSLDNGNWKTKWLVRPLILVSGAGLAIAAIFASVFVLAISLVMVPLIALAGWAMKSNIEARMKEASETENDMPISSTETGEPKPV